MMAFTHLLYHSQFRLTAQVIRPYMSARIHTLLLARALRFIVRYQFQIQI